MSITGDGRSSRGESGRWVVLIDAGTHRWTLFDSKSLPLEPIAYGTEREDLLDIQTAITQCIEGTF